MIEIKYMRYSIVISTYNRHAYLEELIDSLLIQNPLPIEILIIEAGNLLSFSRLENLFGNRPLLRLIHKEKCTLGASRNFGANLANGDCVFYSDDDDIWAPDKAAIVLPLMQAGKILVSHKTDQFPNSRIYGSNITFSIFSIAVNFWGNRFGGGSSLCCRKELVTVIPFNETMRSCEDIEWILRCLFSGTSIGFIDKPLVSYRMNSNGKMGNNVNKNLFWDLYLIKKSLIIMFGIFLGIAAKLVRSFIRILFKR